jgi:hypothetical protein
MVKFRFRLNERCPHCRRACDRSHQARAAFVAQKRIAQNTEPRRPGLATFAWHSTARWAKQSVFAGRIFSARNGEQIFKSVAEPAAQTIPRSDANAQAACTDSTADLTVEGTDSAYNSSVVPASDHTRRERVIFFAPGPITETALRQATLGSAAVLRQRHRHRRRMRWLRDNAVTIVVVFGLLVMAWFVANH